MIKAKRLDELAKQHGIDLVRPTPNTTEVAISDDTKRKLLQALNVSLEDGDETPVAGSKGKKARGALPRCYLPGFLENERVWGISLQLYELRCERNWGIGDFEDLASMVDIVAALGGDFIGLNPLHAPLLADPGRCSPYEPSNRQMLNPLYIAVDKVPGYENNGKHADAIQALRRGDLVDYVGVAELKLDALRDIFGTWTGDVDRFASYTTEFKAFIDERGDILRTHALFEVISFAMVERGLKAGWHSWPEEFQSRRSPAVKDFAERQQDDVRFHMWLQWLAHRQLTAAAEKATAKGLRVGLYLDLAVGEAVDGAATWSEPDVYVSRATVGSPPDPFATEGQDWHLAGMQPAMIAQGKSPPFQRIVSAAMRYAGAIRIDHAAALRRLFLVPVGERPDKGAYVAYPQDALITILATASAEFQCLVIGEDLGLLPEGFQEDLTEAQILSYRILSYERDENGFRQPEDYPALALACISTHDHQTLGGWWRGADIDARERFGIVPPDVSALHIEDRQRERTHLKDALGRSGAASLRSLPSPTAKDTALRSLIVGAHRFVAKTPSRLAAIRLADLTGEKTPTNIPGTSTDHPNWKPKLSVPIESLAGVPLLQDICDAMRQERPRTPDA